MADVIPKQYLDLFDKKAFGNLGTTMQDGSPQVPPARVDYDGKQLRSNSWLGRVKDKEVRRGPRVSIALLDPENPYRYLGSRGRVVGITRGGADSHIDALAKKCLGKDRYPFRKGD